MVRPKAVAPVEDAACMSSAASSWRSCASGAARGMKSVSWWSGAVGSAPSNWRTRSTASRISGGSAAVSQLCGQEGEQGGS
jgi:hypothetical protein